MEYTLNPNLFDILDSMKISIEPQSVVNPGYINDKIAECHKLLEEVEKHYIDISRGLSTFQQAMNNAVTDFEIKKDNLLINDEDIKDLPNIRDREARANSKLRTESRTIRGYENQITQLNCAMKIVNLKNKNLNRANADLKLMVRTMEVQAKFNDFGNVDMATKSLVEEFKKSLINEDSFEDVSSSLVKEGTMDTTVPLDVNNLLTEEGSPATENIIKPKIDSDPITENLITPVPADINNLLTETESPITEIPKMPVSSLVYNLLTGEPMPVPADINNLLTGEPVTENLITPVPADINNLLTGTTTTPNTPFNLDDFLTGLPTEGGASPETVEPPVKKELFAEDGSLIPEEPTGLTKKFLDDLQAKKSTGPIEEEIVEDGETYVDSWVTGQPVSAAPDTDPVNNNELNTIDLDSIIDFTPQKEGGKTTQITPGVNTQKDPGKIQIGIDLDDLLKSLPNLN